jgi:phage tail sheath protein FI
VFKGIFHSWNRRRQLKSATRAMRYRTPGAYVEETSIQSHTIAGVDLSAAAVIGVTDTGPAGTPVAVTDVAGYVATFGDSDDSLLAGVVEAFFANGGQRLYVVGVTALPETAIHMSDLLCCLDNLSDIGMLAVPGFTVAEALNAAANYCEQRRQTVLAADCPANADDVIALQVYRQSIHASSFVALYHPWLFLTGVQCAIPPCGAVMGLMSALERNGEIWKAAAGTRGTLNGVAGLSVSLSERDANALTPYDVNLVRNLTAGNYAVWGARTLSNDNEYKYVNVRRFMIFLEQSIQRGTQWAVFEPNAEPLWASVRRSVEDFLLLQWRSGALQGAKPDKAFFVRCDRSTMTQPDIDGGILQVELGVAPLKPAEFVIIRIQQRTRAAPV